MSLRTRLLKLLQAKEVKENPVARYILMALGKDELWSSENYATLSEAGYKNCTTVYACINQITKNAAGLDWSVENANGDAIDNHPFLDLISHPNEYQGKRAFFIELLSHLLLTGNAYIYQASASSEGSAVLRQPRYLYIMRPDRMTVLAGTGSELVRGYRYKVDGQFKDFDLKQMHHIKLFNPIDDFYGLGPVSAAARAIDISNYADVWNAAIIRNDMKPPGAFTTDGQLNDQQFARLKNQIEEQYQGYNNAGRPLLMDGGLKFTPFSMSPKDLDWLNSNKANLRSICAAFGWPSQLLGDTEASTYSNYQEARKAGYIETILPLMDYITDELQGWIMPLYGQGLLLKLQRDKIDALQENRNEQFTYLENCSFMTINEKRAAVNMDDIGPDGDVVMVRLGLTPLTQAVAEPEPVPAALQAAQGDDQPPPDTIPEDDDDDATEDKSASKTSYWAQPERKEILWKSFDMRVKAREKTFELIAKEYLRRQADSIKAKVNALDSLISVRADGILDVVAETKKYVKQFLPWYMDNFIRAGNAGIQATKGELFDDSTTKASKPTSWVFEMTPDQEKALKQLVFESGTKVNKTALKKIYDQLLVAQEGDLTVNEFAQQLYDNVSSLTDWRSMLWARTESAKVDNFGQLEGYKTIEFVEKKGWMCSFVPDSRDAHIDADGQEVGLKEDFTIDGQGMAYPGDPKGGAGNVCNCLCSTYPVVE